MDTSVKTHDAGSIRAFEWTTQQIEEAMRPAICIMDSLRDAAQDVIPDEMELSMQFEMSIKGETPILKIVSAESTAQIAVKFVWKNENNRS